MRRYEVGGLVVTNGGDNLVGLVTQRDIILAPDEDTSIGSVMTPPDQIISANADISPHEARELLHHHRLEKLPVVGSDGKLVGLITAQDIVNYSRHPDATKDSKGRLCVGAAIGVKATDLERAEALLAAGADLLVLDIAHGHERGSFHGGG
jgi:IMP dehydrogenase